MAILVSRLHVMPIIAAFEVDIQTSTRHRLTNPLMLIRAMLDRQFDCQTGEAGAKVLRKVYVSSPHDRSGQRDIGEDESFDRS